MSALPSPLPRSPFPPGAVVLDGFHVEGSVYALVYCDFDFFLYGWAVVVDGRVVLHSQMGDCGNSAVAMRDALTAALDWVHV